MDIKWTIITAILGSGILSTLISHLLYTQKLKKEQLMKSENGIGRKMITALESAQELMEELNFIEIFEAEDKFKDPNLRAVDGDVLYPAIMGDSESLRKFHTAIRQFREKYERYIDCKTALYIVLLDRYVMQLLLFSSQFEEKYWPRLGTIFIVDFKRISHKCEKRLIRRINKQKYKMEYHNGIKWKILRKFALVKMWEKTILFHLLENKPLKRIEAEAVNEVFSEIESSLEDVEARKN